MAIGLIILIIYFVIAVLFGYFNNVLLLSDEELNSEIESSKERYVFCFIIGLFWIITLPMLLFNNKDKNIWKVGI